MNNFRYGGESERTSDEWPDEDASYFRFLVAISASKHLARDFFKTIRKSRREIGAGHFQNDEKFVVTIVIWSKNLVSVAKEGMKRGSGETVGQAVLREGDSRLEVWAIS